MLPMRLVKARFRIRHHLGIRTFPCRLLGAIQQFLGVLGSSHRHEEISPREMSALVRPCDQLLLPNKKSDTSMHRSVACDARDSFGHGVLALREIPAAFIFARGACCRMG